MHEETLRYNRAQSPGDREICEWLAREIELALPEAENKVWHGHPAWFLDGNPVVKFKAAEARFTAAEQVATRDLRACLAESRDVQWDYKNIVRRKGRLERLR